MCSIFGYKKSHKPVSPGSLVTEKQKIESICVKIMIIGDSAVGKTALMTRFCDQLFDPNYIQTIGLDFRQKFIEHCGKKVKIQVWDTAGQDRFNTLVNAYYRGASGILLVYDITEGESFNHVARWMQNIEDRAKSDVVKCIVANKVDMHCRRVVSEQAGQKLAEKYDVPYIETSAKLNVNVDKAFFDLTQAILDRKVSHRKAEDYKLPPISVCPPYWIDNEKLKATNLSKNAISYALSFNFDTFKHVPFCENLTENGKNEFNSYIRENRIDGIVEFYKHVSFDHHEIVTVCHGCVNETGVKHYTVFGICFLLNFRNDNNDFIGTFNYKIVLIKNLNLNFKPVYLKSLTSHILYVNPDLSFAMQTNDIVFQEKIANVISIKPKIALSMNKPDRPCLENAERNYSQSLCNQNCLSEKAARSCTVCFKLQSFVGPTDNRKDYPLCNKCDYVKGNYDKRCDLNTTLLISECSRKCPPLCEETSFQISSANYGLSSDNERGGGFAEQLDNVTELFINFKINSNGVEVQEEYLVYSMETMVSNVGGVLGLWVGASIMTLVQLAVFFVRCVIQDFFPRTKKVVKS